MRGTITKRKLKSGRFSWGYVFDAGRDENGKRRQIVKKGFDTKRACEDALRNALEISKKGGDFQKGRDLRTFRTFFCDWLAQHGANHWGRMTAEQNGKRAAYAIRMFGEVPLQELSSMRLEKDLGTLLASGGRKTGRHPDGGPLSPKTVREIAALVSQSLDKAVKWNLIERNPMRGCGAVDSSQERSADPGARRVRAIPRSSAGHSLLRAERIRRGFGMPAG